MALNGAVSGAEAHVANNTDELWKDVVASTWSQSSAVAISGDRVWKIPTGSALPADVRRYLDVTAIDTALFEFRIHLLALPTAALTVFTFEYSTIGTAAMTFKISSGGVLSIDINGTAVTGSTISTGTTYLIGLKFVRNASGSELRLNGAVDITNNTNYDHAVTRYLWSKNYAKGAGDGADIYCDDWIPMDTTGSTFNALSSDDGYRIRAIRVPLDMGGGVTNNWAGTGEATNRYLNVDDGLTINSADYNSETTTNEEETWALGATNIGASRDYAAVQFLWYANLSAAGGTDLLSLGEGGAPTYYDYTTLAVGGGTLARMKQLELTPVGGLAWTGARFNTLEMGGKRVATSGNTIIYACGACIIDKPLAAAGGFAHSFATVM